MVKVVKYNNDMNNVSLGNFKEKELDLFFSICYKMKERGESEQTFTFKELKHLSSYSYRGLERFYKDLDQTYKKLINLNFKIENDERIVRFVLFTEYEISKKDRIVRIKMNEKFRYLLNDLFTNYTQLDLLEFVSLKSTYSKNMFKLLKQWETVKEKTYTLENFKELLGVPLGYNSTNLNERIIKPIHKELSRLFHNLKITKLKTGNKITSLKFSWSSKKEICQNKTPDFIEISKELKDTIQKNRSNRFVEPFLTVANINKLLSAFDEKALIRGLGYARKNISVEFKKLSYLINSIKAGATQQQLLFLEVPKAVEIVEIVERVEVVQEVTKEQYQALYLSYLKDNNIKHSKMSSFSFDKANSKTLKIIDKKTDYPKELLLSKTGKPLYGGALQLRLRALGK